MFTPKITQKLQNIQTPFYYYNMGLLEQTLKVIQKESSRHNFQVHYAVKANANNKILDLINDYGFGADCVSGNEIQRALDRGFTSSKIVYAGVGKSDAEINLALEAGIFCFNCESIPELEVINQLAAAKGICAKVALRINPNVDAHTHHYITTGIEENKFGINRWELEQVIQLLEKLDNIELIGLHFHIGSQITDLGIFKGLCIRINEFQQWFTQQNIHVSHINVGGGFGVDYQNPDQTPIPDFENYFATFAEFLQLKPQQTLHFELGRSVVAQCGSLIARVLYVKNGVKTRFAILDAGMTELLRPALYQAFHKIENLTSQGKNEPYNVVGPICESSDCFGKSVPLPPTQRNDLMAIRSTGAYGEIMASRYSLREIAPSIFSNEM